MTWNRSSRPRWSSPTSSGASPSGWSCRTRRNVPWVGSPGRAASSAPVTPAARSSRSGPSSPITPMRSSACTRRPRISPSGSLCGPTNAPMPVGPTRVLPRLTLGVRAAGAAGSSSRTSSARRSSACAASPSIGLPHPCPWNRAGPFPTRGPPQPTGGPPGVLPARDRHVNGFRRRCRRVVIACGRPLMRRWKEAKMPERDGYIPGVPCWIDTSHPDPEAVLVVLRRPVRLGVRGRACPRTPAASTSSAASAAATSAAIGSVPEGAPPMAMWNTYIWVDNADDTAAKAREAGGAVLAEPFDVMDVGADGGARRPRGRGVQRLAGAGTTRARRSSTSTAR